MLRLILACLIALLAAVVLIRVTVPPPAQTAASPLAELTEDDARVRAIYAALRREGLSAALDSLEALVEREPGAEPAAHQLLHGLARTAMHESGYDIALVQQCRPVFHSGCFHGTLEAYFSDASRLNAGVIRSACAGYGKPDHPHALECAHGMGHGLLGALDHDVFAALRHCDGLPAGQAQWCYSGAFMENVNAAVLEEAGAGAHAHHGAAATGGAHGPGDAAAGAHGAGPPAQHEHLRAEDPHYPCNAVEPRHRHTCYFYQPFTQLRTNGFDFAATLATCDGAPEGSVASCYHGFGTQVAGLLPAAPARVFDACLAGRAQLAPHCAEGAAEYLVDLAWDAARGMEFCALAPAALRAPCFERVGSRITLIHDDREAREHACNGAGELDAVRACRAGAGLGEES